MKGIRECENNFKKYNDFKILIIVFLIAGDEMINIRTRLIHISTNQFNSFKMISFTKKLSQREISKN